MTVSRLPLVNLHVAPQAQVAHVGKRVSSCKQTTWARQFIKRSENSARLHSVQK